MAQAREIPGLLYTATCSLIFAARRNLTGPAKKSLLVCRPRIRSAKPSWHRCRTFTWRRVWMRQAQSSNGALMYC